MEELDQIISNLKININKDMSSIHDLKDIYKFKELSNQLEYNYNKYLKNFILSKLLTKEQLYEIVPQHKIEEMLINGYKKMHKYSNKEELNKIYDYYCKKINFNESQDLKERLLTNYIENESSFESIVSKQIQTIDTIYTYSYFIIDTISNAILPISTRNINKIDYNYNSSSGLIQTRKYYPINIEDTELTIKIKDNLIKFIFYDTALELEYDINDTTLTSIKSKTHNWSTTIDRNIIKNKDLRINQLLNQHVNDFNF